MTTIAWDGNILAADTQADLGSYKAKVTKIFKIKNHLVFSSGAFDRINALFQWFENGADPDKYPAFQSNNDDSVCLNIITPEKIIMRYERTPYPFIVNEPFFACGSGRDFALAAMHLGLNAKQAVGIAHRFDPHTGSEIDTLTIE